MFDFQSTWIKYYELKTSRYIRIFHLFCPQPFQKFRKLTCIHRKNHKAPPVSKKFCPPQPLYKITERIKLLLFILVQKLKTQMERTFLSCGWKKSRITWEPIEKFTFIAPPNTLLLYFLTFRNHFEFQPAQSGLNWKSRVTIQLVNSLFQTRMH